MRLYVKFEYQTSERELRDLFAPYGLTADPVICHDHDGKSIGFGFVEVENGESAITDLNATSHRGWPLVVEPARKAAGDPRRRPAGAESPCPRCGRAIRLVA